MAQLSISGRVLHAPGPWGAGFPASNVAVEVIQNRRVQPQSEVIWSGQTDAAGRFSGTTREWRRMIRVGAGPTARTLPDPSEVLALSLRVKDGSAQQATLPFVHNAAAPSPPVLLPWGPSPVGRVNGVACWSVSDFAAKARAAMRSQVPVTIEVPAASGGTDPIQKILIPFLQACYEALPRSSGGGTAAIRGGHRLAAHTSHVAARPQAVSSAAGAVAAARPDSTDSFVNAILLVLITVGLCAQTVIVTAPTAAANVALLALENVLLPLVLLPVGSAVAVTTATITIIQHAPALARVVAEVLRATGFSDAANDLDRLASLPLPPGLATTLFVILIVCALTLGVFLAGAAAARSAWENFLSSTASRDAGGGATYVIHMGG